MSDSAESGPVLDLSTMFVPGSGELPVGQVHLGASFAARAAHADVPGDADDRERRAVSLPKRTRLPTGSWPGQNRRAAVSLTMTDNVGSCGTKLRPCRSAIPIAFR